MARHVVAKTSDKDTTWPFGNTLGIAETLGAMAKTPTIAARK